MSLQLGHQQPPNASAATVRPDDHPEHPGRTISPLLDVELTQPDGTDRRSRPLDSHERDGEPLTTSLPAGDIHPPRQVFRFRRVPPLRPADFADGSHQVRSVGQQLYRYRIHRQT